MACKVRGNFLVTGDLIVHGGKYLFLDGGGEALMGGIQPLQAMLGSLGK